MKWLYTGIRDFVYTILYSLPPAILINAFIMLWITFYRNPLLKENYIPSNDKLADGAIVLLSTTMSFFFRFMVSIITCKILYGMVEFNIFYLIAIYYFVMGVMDIVLALLIGLFMMTTMNCPSKIKDTINSMQEVADKYILFRKAQNNFKFLIFYLPLP